MLRLPWLSVNPTPLNTWIIFMISLLLYSFFSLSCCSFIILWRNKLITICFCRLEPFFRKFFCAGSRCSHCSLLRLGEIQKFYANTEWVEFILALKSKSCFTSNYNWVDLIFVIFFASWILNCWLPVIPFVLFFISFDFFWVQRRSNLCDLSCTLLLILLCEIDSFLAKSLWGNSLLLTSISGCMMIFLYMSWLRLVRYILRRGKSTLALRRSVSMLFVCINFINGK